MVYNTRMDTKKFKRKFTVTVRDVVMKPLFVLATDREDAKAVAITIFKAGWDIFLNPEHWENIPDDQWRINEY
jgi:hypothetical protein